MTEEQQKEYGTEVTRFGDWMVTTKGILWFKAKPAEYFIYKDELTFSKAYGSEKVYDRLLDLSGKDWLSVMEVLDLNKAYFYAVDHFKCEKLSESETLSLQNRILSDRKAS